jgi:(R,R)-butanediol dehydrogenase/meso-butanediol dehydrogenase/diacetyl reductase
MKALVYHPTGTLHIEDKKQPVLQPGEALIQIKLAGICGSDMVAWQGGFKRIVNPVILGHEMTGEVAQIADPAQSDVAVGDRVVIEPLVSCGQCEPCKKGYYNVCRNLKVIGLDQDGGFTSYVRVPANRVHRIPDHLSFERAVFSEPLAVSIHMVRRTNLQIGNSVAVFGAGPIGMIVALVAREAGASKIMITDINDYRLQLASDLGFAVADAKQSDWKSRFMDYFGAEGADISFELAASKDTMEAALDITKIRGTILAGGIFKDPPVVDLQKLTLKEQHLIGSRVYTYSDFETAIRLLSQPGFPIEKLISKHTDLDQSIEEGFQAIKNGADVMKVLIHPEQS